MQEPTTLTNAEVTVNVSRLTMIGEVAWLLVLGSSTATRVDSATTPPRLAPIIDHQLRANTMFVVADGRPWLAAKITAPPITRSSWSP